MRLVRFAAVLPMFAVFLPMAAWAQPRLQFGQPTGFRVNGFHIYDVTLAAGYTSQVGALGSGSAVPGLGGDWEGWASVSGGYSKLGPDGAFSVTYTPGYIGHLRYPDLNGVQQKLNIDVSRRLNSKWTTFFSLAGEDTTFDNFLFNPNGLSQIVSATGDPADALGGGSAGLGPQTLVFGTRIRTASAFAGAVYRPTPRFNIFISSGAALSQSVRDDRPDRSTAALIPRNLNFQEEISMSYSVNPRTEIGARTTTYRNQGSYGAFQSTSLVFFANRRLGEHWFASGDAGPSFSNYIGNVGTPSLTYAADASLAYRMRSSSLAATYSRYSGDTYGLGARITQSALGAWNWTSLSSGWTFSANGGKEWSSGDGALGFTSVRGGATIGRILTRQLSLGLEYSYISYSNRSLPGLEAHVARLALNWIPFLRDTPPLLKPGNPTPTNTNTTGKQP